MTPNTMTDSEIFKDIEKRWAHISRSRVQQDAAWMIRRIKTLERALELIKLERTYEIGTEYLQNIAREALEDGR